MFVGHEFVAFAIVGWGASRVGFDDRSARRLGIVAGLAALLPDLDVFYAVATYALAVAGGTPLGWEAFWGVANGVHRVVTHPLPVGVAAALVFGLGAALSARQRSESARPDRVGVTLFGGAVILYVAVLIRAFRGSEDQTAAVVAIAFLAVVAVVGVLVGYRTRLPTRALTAAAGVGFLTHPFGDVLLAAPPPLLSPFGPPLLTERVSLATDPTLEILGVLFVELVAVWFGIAVAAGLGYPRESRSTSSDFRAGSGGRLLGVVDHVRRVVGRLRGLIDPRAIVGVAYAAAVFVLPRPTIVDAHVLGFTIVPLAFGVGVWVAARARITARNVPATRTGWPNIEAVAYGAIAGLSTLTIAAVSYLSTYVLFGAV
ncbi:metal-dependent hydrolase [Halobellus captivus]|uniref:metal-dependent hydrolase n=1 Tax=Halobellus captivus TaxID=2592614 RepID=UPI0011A6E468|nr:metal-dependent hydrolase [Halobellus captivus]